MSNFRLFLGTLVAVAVGLASSASAATSWTHLGAHPFSRPALTSEADLRAVVGSRGADLKDGFTRAGDPDLYPAFVEQFPTAKIDTVKVAPGETFAWMVFRKRARGRVSVLKDVTWKGAEPFDAFRFHIDKGGKRHEFIVPYVCANVALRSVGAVPPPPVAAAPAPPPAPPAPVPAAPPAPAPAPARAAAPAVVVVEPTPPPAPPPVAVVPAPKPAPAAVAAVVVAPPPAPAPAAAPRARLLVDVGLSRQLDPANYVFARVGCEFPLAEQLFLMGLVGGDLRWMGNDGGNAFTADVLLDYHWVDRYSFGLGAGFWSGNDGQVDALADVGYRVSGPADGKNWSLFAEARLPFDELDNANEYLRLGLGVRFRF